MTGNFVVKNGHLILKNNTLLIGPLPAPGEGGNCCCTPCGPCTGSLPDGVSNYAWYRPQTSAYVCEEYLNDPAYWNNSSGTVPTSIQDIVDEYQHIADQYNDLWEQWVPVIESGGYTCVRVEKIKAGAFPWDYWGNPSECTNPKEIRYYWESKENTPFHPGPDHIAIYANCCGTEWDFPPFWASDPNFVDPQLSGPGGTLTYLNGTTGGQMSTPQVRPCLMDGRVNCPCS